MRESASGRGRGKLILCGEHAVVHGYPAIALGVDLGTTVHLQSVRGPTRAVGDVPDDPRLARALEAVLGPSGWEVRIESALPIGRGMGSSAALAVALVRAAAAAAEEPLDAEQVHRRAFAVERVFHGNPSGIDHAVSARGGLVRYRRAPTGPELIALPCPTWSLVVLDSGHAGDTGALVRGVASRRPGIDPVLLRIGTLVDEAASVLDDTVALGTLLDENHALLGEIGVSTPRLDELVSLARQAGAAGAKLSGAGGGGVVIALVDDPAPVVAAARHAGLAPLVCRPEAT